MSRNHSVDSRWNAVFADFRRSGLTQIEFCRRRRVSIHTFRKRLYQPRASKTTPSNHRSSAPADRRFIPVKVVPDPIPSTAASQPQIEIILANGRRIAVAPGFDPQTLRRLVAVMEQPQCLD